MRQMWDNLLASATLSATNEDPNRPVENVFSNTNETVFGATGTTSVVLAEWDEGQEVSALVIGNHNVDTMIVTLKDSGGSTIGSPYSYSWSDLVWTSPKGRVYPLNRVYLQAAVAGVRSAEISLTSIGGALSIGGLFLGGFLQYPNIAVRPTKSYRHTGSIVKTAGLVSFETPGERAVRWKTTPAVLEVEDEETVADMYEALGPGRTSYWDIYEDRDDVRPMLANIVSSVLSMERHPGSGPFVFRNFSFEIEEAR